MGNPIQGCSVHIVGRAGRESRQTPRGRQAGQFAGRAVCRQGREDRQTPQGRQGSPRAAHTCGGARGVVDGGAGGGAGAVALPQPGVLPAGCQPAGVCLEGAGEIGPTGLRCQRHIIQRHVTQEPVTQGLEGHLPPRQRRQTASLAPGGTGGTWPSPGTAAGPWRAVSPVPGARCCLGCHVGSTALSPPLPPAAA